MQMSQGCHQCDEMSFNSLLMPADDLTWMPMGAIDPPHLSRPSHPLLICALASRSTQTSCLLQSLLHILVLAHIR